MPRLGEGGECLTRAEPLQAQSTTADEQMVNSHPQLSAGQWLRRFVIETGGLLDVSLRPECADKNVSDAGRENPDYR